MELDDQLMTFVNLLGISVVGLIVGFHFLQATRKARRRRG
jgi:hypothetical protein